MTENVSANDLVITDMTAEDAELVLGALESFTRWVEADGTAEEFVFTNSEGLIDYTDAGREAFKHFAAGYASREQDIRERAEAMYAAFNDMIDEIEAEGGFSLAE